MQALNEVPKMVIHLPIRTDRMQSFLNEAIHLGYNKSAFIFSPGIVEEKPSAGIGKAHLLAMQDAFNHSEYALIMEDDVTFPGRHKTIAHINACLENAPAEWDILLGGLYHQEGQNNFNDHWDSVDKFSGLHFYIISKQAYQRLKENYKFDDHIDRWISNNNFKVFVMHEFCAMQKDGYSDNVKYVTKYNQLYSKRFNILKP